MTSLLMPSLPFCSSAPGDGERRGVLLSFPGPERQQPEESCQAPRSEPSLEGGPLLPLDPSPEAPGINLNPGT